MRLLVARRAPQLKVRSGEPQRPGARSRVAVRQALDAARLHRRIMMAAGLALGAVCLFFVFASPVFAVRHVRVTGLSALLPEEAAQVQSVAIVPARTNLFRARTKQLAAKIESLPWVAKAEVTRRLPGALGVQITPRRSAALLTAPNGKWEVDCAGLPIRAARANTRLPEIAAATEVSVNPGVPVDYPGLAGAVLALRATSDDTKARLTKIEVDQNGNICLNMSDGIAIRLGQVDDLPAKLALIRRIYTNDPNIGAKVEAIDLRSPEAPAATPRKNGSGSSEDSPRRSVRHHHAHSHRAPVGSQSESNEESTERKGRP